MKSSRTRTRLTPEARYQQLLDSAKLMIVEEGLQAFTMEGLARFAGVSAPLIYNYFPSRPALLQALLQREYGEFVTATAAMISTARTFEDVVRVSVTSNFDHHAPGNILPLLQNQPEIANAIEDERASLGRKNARFLVKSAADTYQLSIRQAQLVVAMASGASIAAAEFAAQAGLAREQAIETAVQYILAGMEKIAGADDH